MNPLSLPLHLLLPVPAAMVRAAGRDHGWNRRAGHYALE